MAYLMSPTVLVVDDEQRFGESLKKALLNFGSIGAIFVAKLRDAADMIRNKEFHFDAIITDIAFEQGEAPELNLYDGLDLIEFAQRVDPTIERYAYSAHIETAGYNTKIEQRKLDVKKFFDKRQIAVARGKRDDNEGLQPWNVVRADILRKRLRANPALYRELKLDSGQNLTDEGVLERVVSTLHPPTVTYIQNLNEKFSVKIPIQVICTSAADGAVLASAPKLGLLIDGIGQTPVEAVDNLREVIADHCESLLQSKQALSGYAELVRDELLRYLEIRGGDAS
jgi:hypothetical protein